MAIINNVNEVLHRIRVKLYHPSLGGTSHLGRVELHT
jgi:hypothetical protein